MSQSVVLIDDDPVILHMAEDLLKSIGCGVRPFGSSVEALNEIRRQPPDLIVTDLDMPEATGRDVVRQVKRDFPNLPVVVMTASGSEREAIGCFRDGATDYVMKGQLDQELVEVALKVLGTKAVAEKRERPVPPRPPSSDADPQAATAPSTGASSTSSSARRRSVEETQEALASEYLIQRRKKKGPEAAAEEAAKTIVERRPIALVKQAAVEISRPRRPFTPERVATIRQQLERLRRWEELAQRDARCMRTHERQTVESVFKIFPWKEGGGIDQAGVVEAFCVDISRGGCRLLVDQLIEGSWVIRLLNPQGGATDILSTVVRSQVALGMYELGMRFVKRLE